MQSLLDRENHGYAQNVGRRERYAAQIADLTEKKRGQQHERRGRGPAEEGLPEINLDADVLLEEATAGDGGEGAVEHRSQSAVDKVEAGVELVGCLAEQRQVIGGRCAKAERERDRGLKTRDYGAKEQAVDHRVTP